MGVSSIYVSFDNSVGLTRQGSALITNAMMLCLTKTSNVISDNCVCKYIAASLTL